MGRIKNGYKKILSEVIYRLYQMKVLDSKLQVANLDKTIDELIYKKRSFVRFGDGEIRLIEGNSLPLQKADRELALRLKEILMTESDKLMIGIPDIFISLKQYRKESQRFWKEHLLFFRKKYEKYCNHTIDYYDSFFSRLYYMYNNRNLSKTRFQKIKNIWKDKDVVIIESKTAHTGVDNDLLIKVNSVKRVICPEENAWDVYEILLKQALRYDKDTLFLVSAGPTAKPLVADLMKAGFRALDIGSLDMEYQWYLMNATQKCHPSKKNCITFTQDQNAGYYKYLSEIDFVIDGVKA